MDGPQLDLSRCYEVQTAGKRQVIMATRVVAARHWLTNLLMT